MKQEKRRFATDASLCGGNSQVGYELMNTDYENQKGAFIMQETEREPVR